MTTHTGTWGALQLQSGLRQLTAAWQRLLESEPLQRNLIFFFPVILGGISSASFFKIKYFVFGDFDPEMSFLYNRNKWFSGWPKTYMSAYETTPFAASTRWTGWPIAYELASQVLILYTEVFLIPEILLTSPGGLFITIAKHVNKKIGLMFTMVM